MAKQTTPNSPKQSQEVPQLPVGLPEVPKGSAKVLKSDLAYKGHVFSVYTETVEEPEGVRATRDVVRHNGSVVILAVDEETDPADPVIVIERQFRHAAGQYHLELTAGRL